MDEENENASDPYGFVLPPDLVVEPELQGPAPRPVPQCVYEGDYVLGLKLLQWSLLTVAALCMVAQFVPFIQNIAWYILPLGYIGWIGVLFMGCYLAAVLYLSRGAGSLKYLVHGQPTVGEILEITKAPTVLHEGTVTHFAFVTSVLLEHPETGKAIMKTISSKNFSIEAEANYQCTLRARDFVTVLYLPESKEAPFQVYGFLGLNYAVKFIREVESPKASAGDVMLGLAVFAAVVGGFAALFTHEIYQPLDFPLNGLTLSIITFGALSGLLLLVAGYRYQRQQKRECKKIEERISRSALSNHVPQRRNVVAKWAAVVAALCGAPLVGGLVAFSGLLLCNGLFDHSEVRHQSVYLQQPKVETYALIVRHYKIRYTMEGEEKKRTLLTSPSGLVLLEHVDAGLATIKQGNLGWPWVAAIVPVEEFDSPS